MMPPEPLVWHLLLGCQVVLLDIFLLIDTFSSTPRWGDVLIPPDFYSSNCIFSELGIYFQVFFLNFIHRYPCLLTYVLIQLMLFVWFKFHATILNSTIISNVLSFLFFWQRSFILHYFMWLETLIYKIRDTVCFCCSLLFSMLTLCPTVQRLPLP